MWPFKKKSKSIDDLAREGFKRAVEFDEIVRGNYELEDPLMELLRQDIAKGGPFSRFMEREYGLKRKGH